MSDYQTELHKVCRKSRSENDKREKAHILTHTILESDDSNEVKIMRLHTECRFGMQRATELVTGKAYQKPVYKNAELNKDLGRFYKIDS